MKAAVEYLQLDKRHPCDERPMPRWATGPDGRSVKIEGDVRFGQMWAEWLGDACQHERRGIVRWINAGNQVCHNWYCGTCGHKLSSNIRAELAGSHGFHDVDLDSLASRSLSYVSERERRLEAMKLAAAERVQPEQRSSYDDYLRSDAWMDLRSRVMKRAGHVCEGCLERPAEHVHHLTYANLGNEFAFELRALCSLCHARAHAQEAA